MMLVTILCALFVPSLVNVHNKNAGDCAKTHALWPARLLFQSINTSANPNIMSVAMVIPYMLMGIHCNKTSMTGREVCIERVIGDDEP